MIAVDTNVLLRYLLDDDATQSKKATSIITAICGITENNIQQLIQHHTDMAAVISSLFAADDIKHRVRLLSQHFS